MAKSPFWVVIRSHCSCRLPWNPERRGFHETPSTNCSQIWALAFCASETLFLLAFEMEPPKKPAAALRLELWPFQKLRGLRRASHARDQELRWKPPQNRIGLTSNNLMVDFENKLISPPPSSTTKALTNRVTDSSIRASLIYLAKQIPTFAVFSTL